MQLKLGKLPAKFDPRTIRWKNIRRGMVLYPPNYDLDVALGGLQDTHVYANDTYGDCVIASRAHMTLRFELFEQKQVVSITDQDVTTEYFKESGGKDSGLVMLDSLNAWRQQGWLAAGNLYTIYAYAALSTTDLSEMKEAVFSLCGAYLGIAVPQSAIDQFNLGQPWDIVENDGGIVGGHAINVVAYDEKYFYIMTWGRRQPVTPAFLLKYMDEVFGLVDNRDIWLESSPVDVQALQNTLNDITHQPSPPPTPSASPCKVGNGIAGLLNIYPRLMHRKGRFTYANWPKSALR